MFASDNSSFLNLVKDFQKCQRNFDLTRSVDQETIEWLLEAGLAAPTKQNLYSFDIVCIKNRELIEEVSCAAVSESDDLRHLSTDLQKKLKKGRVQNPQTNSNVLFLFFLRKDDIKSRERKRREQARFTEEYWRICTNLEIGIAAGVIGMAAHSIGLKTGFCRCINHDLLPHKKFKRHNLNSNNLEAMLGVGYPLYNDHTLHTDGINRSSSLPKIAQRRIII